MSDKKTCKCCEETKHESQCCCNTDNCKCEQACNCNDCCKDSGCC